MFHVLSRGQLDQLDQKEFRLEKLSPWLKIIQTYLIDMTLCEQGDPGVAGHIGVKGDQV